jgi:hypothetical protein
MDVVIQINFIINYMDIEKIIARNQKLREDYLREAKLTALQELNFNIRSWTSERFGIWDIWDILPHRWQRFYYDKIKTIFKPHHSRLRKAIPRQWNDLTSIIVDVNFEMIKSFYEDEYSKDIVDWESDEHHKTFAQWLESAYKYITIERPQLEKQKDVSYPESNFDDLFGEPETDKHGNVTRIMKSCEERYGKPYEEVYGEVNKLENLIDQKDTETIISLIKNRNYFWT